MEQLNTQYPMNLDLIKALNDELFEIESRMQYTRDFCIGPFDSFSTEYQDYVLNYEDEITSTITKYESLIMKVI